MPDLHSTAGLVEHHQGQNPGLDPEDVSQAVCTAIDELYAARDRNELMHEAGASVGVAVLKVLRGERP